MTKILKELWYARISVRILSAVGLFFGALILAICVIGLGWLGEMEGRKSGWLVLSKSEGFANRELTELRNQEFTKSLWPVVMGNFSSYASLGFGTSFYGTELFLEALSDDALDKIPPGWDWKSGDSQVPLIISREFLGLYNFGFAPARGLPPLYEKNMDALPLFFRFRGPLGTWELPGKIVGFTDRYTTILAPLEFIHQANLELSGAFEKNPVRVALEVKDPGSPDVTNFINLKKWGVNKELLRSSDFVNLAKSFLGGFGIMAIVLVLLAFTLQVLGIKLKFEESKGELKTLLLFGASPKKMRKILLGLQINTLLISGSLFLTLSVLMILFFYKGLQEMSLNPFWLWFGLFMGFGSFIFAFFLADRSLKTGIAKINGRNLHPPGKISHLL